MESKINQVQVAYQQFYTTIGAEDVWKSALDGIRNYIDTLNSLPKAFDVVPTGAIAMIGNLVGLIKTLLINLLADIANMWQDVMQNTVNQSAQTAANGGRQTGLNFIQQLINEIRNGTPQVRQAMQQTINDSAGDISLLKNSTIVNLRNQLLNASGSGATPGGVGLVLQNYIDGLTQAGARFSDSFTASLVNQVSQGVMTAEQALSQLESKFIDTAQVMNQTSSKFSNFIGALGDKNSATSRGLTSIAQSLTLVGSLLNKDTEGAKRFAGAMTGIGGAVQALGALPRLIGGDLTALPQLVMGILNVINGFSIGIETDEEKLDRLTKEAEELSNIAKQSKSDVKTLDEGIQKIKELQEKRYESAEAAEEYQNAVDDLTNQFPLLIQGFDSAGNAIFNINEAEDALAAARQATAQATYAALQAEADKAEQERDNAKKQLQQDASIIFGPGGIATNLGYQQQTPEDLLTKYGIASFIGGSKSELDAALISLYDSNPDLFSGLTPYLKQVKGKHWWEPDYNVLDSDEITSLIQNQQITDLEEEQLNVLKLLLGITTPDNLISNEQKYLETAIAEAEALENKSVDDNDYQQHLFAFGDAMQKLQQVNADLYNGLLDTYDLEQFIQDFENVQGLDSQVESVNKQLVSGWLNAKKAQLEFMTENSGLAQVLTNELFKAQQEYEQQTGEDDFLSHPISSGAQAIVDAYDEFYNNLSVAEQDHLNEMLANQEKYSSQDFRQFARDENGGVIEERQEVVNELEQQLVENEQKRGKRLEKLYREATGIGNVSSSAFGKGSNVEKSLSTLATNVSESEAELQSTLLTQAKDLRESGFGEKATIVANTSTSIQSTLQTVDGALSDTISDIIIKNGVTTREGLQKSIEEIESLAGQKEYSEYSDQLNSIASDLTVTRDTIIENLALSVQTALNSFGDDTKKVVQTLSKARSGIGATEFDELIQQAQALGVNLNLDDFERQGGKMILKAGKYTDLIQAFLDGIDNTTAEFDALTDEYGQFFDSEDDNAATFREALKDRSTSDLADSSAQVGVYLEDYKVDGKMDAAAWDAYYEAWYNALGETLENNKALRLLLDLQREELELQTNLQEGMYGKALGYNADFTDDTLKKYAKDTTFEKGSVEAQIKDSLNTGYSSLLSDVLSKGFEYINLADYDGLTNEALIQRKLNEAISTNDYSGFIDYYIDFTGKTLEEANALRIQALEKENQKFNVVDALKDFKYNKDGIAYASLQTLQTIADALGEDVTTLFDEATYNAALGGYQVKTGVLNSLLESIDTGQEADNLITAAQEKAKSEADTSTILSNIISSYDKISEDNIAALANILGHSYNWVEQNLISTSVDGAKQLNLLAFNQLIEDGTIQVSEAVSSQLLQIADNTISAITQALTSNSKGFTNMAEMSATLDEINKYNLSDKQYIFDDIYNWDENLNAFVFTSQGLIAQIQTLYNQLPTLTEEQQRARDYLIESSLENVAKEINVTDFITAREGSKTYTDFTNAVQTYLDVANAIGEESGIFIKGVGELLARQLTPTRIIDILRSGGENAVKMAKVLADAAGEELSAEDIEAIYRGPITNLTNALEELTATTGDIVSKEAYDILRAAGYSGTELEGSGQYLITQMGTISDAYRAYYEALKASNGITLKQLNDAAAQMLSHEDGSDAIEALGDAANMTYERFGEILTANGYELSEELIKTLEDNNLIDLIGGGKLRILDFEGFASAMHWEIGSEEYVSAFKTYNDAMIEWNKKTENSILEEVKSLQDVHIGDQINLTQLSSSLDKLVYGTWTSKNGAAYKGLNNPLIELSEQLNKYGADLEKGILTLGPESNIPAIIQTISEYAQEYGGLLAQDVAALADVLDNTLKNFANAISTGIQGKLSNEDAFNLQEMARSLGLDVDIQFTKTADGFKLAKNSAVELYQELKEVDGLAASIVFDELTSSLTKAGEGLENISQTMAQISVLEEKIQTNENTINHLRELGANQTTIDNIEAENSKLKEQLSLYQQIAAEQMMDPDSFDFMGRDLPDIFKGPENYWNSIGEAYKAMNQAASSGYMAIDDFYNIVNEMQNLAVMSGDTIDFLGQKLGNGTAGLANIIEAGFSNLSNIDGDGVKISLKGLAADIQIGAADMSTGFDDAVKTMAEGQIKMLDGLIALLEAIVQMENLKNVDADLSGVIEFDEIFDTDGSFTDKYEIFQKQLTETLENNTELATLFKQIQVQGHSLYEIVTATSDELAKLGIEKDQFVDIINALYQAGISDNYDLENLIPSILQTLSGTGQTFTYTNDKGYQLIVDSSGQVFEIDWEGETTEEKIKAAVDVWNANHPNDQIGPDGSKEWAQNLVNKWTGTDEVDQQELTIEERAEIGIITGKIITFTDEETGEQKFQSPNGGIYDSAEECVAAMELEKLGATNIEEVSVNADKSVNVKGEMSIGETTWTVTTNGNGTIVYTASDGTEYTNPEFFAEHQGRILWEQAGSPDGELDYHVGQVNAKIRADVNPSFELSGGAGANGGLSAEQKSNLMQLLKLDKESLQNTLKNTPPETLEVKYGLKYTPGTTGEDTLGELQQFAELNGVETKYLNLVLNIQTPEGTDLNSLFGSGAGGEEATPGGDITLKPSSVTFDLESVTPTISAGEENSISIPSLDAAVDKMLIKSISSTEMASGVENTTPTNDVTVEQVTAAVTTLLITSIGSTSLASTEGQTTDISVETASGTIADLMIDSIKSSHYDATLVLSEDIAQGEANITNLSVGATNMTPNSALAALQTMNFTTTSTSLTSVSSAVGKISGASFSNFSDLSGVLGTIQSQVDTIWVTIQNFANQTFTVNMNYSGGPTVGTTGTGSVSTPTVDTSSITSGLSSITTAMSTLQQAVSSIPDKSTAVSNTASAMDELHDKSGPVGNTASAIDRLHSKSVSVGVTGTVTGRVNALINVSVRSNTQGVIGSTSVNFTTSQSTTGSAAKGNVALAKGTAAAKGKKTLMGELGPELVVSNGRYFVVGEDGPEMVDLAQDAIVFNHQQTEDLLKRGRTRKTGTPSTSEKNAISFAKGTEGPAMASAASALAALRQLRAMWQSLLDASARDLGSKAGSGGGGGGGGGGGNGPDPGYIHDLEIWYNLLRQIDHIETHISEQEKLQSKLESDRVANGYALFNSYQRELDLLNQQVSRHRELLDLQKKYYTQRAAELNSTNFSKIFTFDEDGLMQYADSLSEFIAERTKETGSGWAFNGNTLHITGKNFQYDDEGNLVTDKKGNAKTVDFSKDIVIPQTGLGFLALLNSTDANGLATYTAEEQVEILKAFGFGDEIKYDSEGKEIKEGEEGSATAMVEAFWDRLEGWQDEMDSLYDSVHEQEEAILEAQQKQNEILQKLVDNQISIEEDILNAIEAREQAEIDRLTEEKDALQDSADKFIEGLTDQLNKEQQMYQDNQSDQELTKLQRQLAILQRSGGSASQIRSLQEQIDNKQQDMYFQKQQEQIDAIKEASDKQIQQMEEQIDLMTETLEYQKENGLFWQEVREIMMMQPQEVIDLLMQWNPDYRSKSELQISEDLRDFKSRFQVWAGERQQDELNQLFDSLTSDVEKKFKDNGFELSDRLKEQAREAFNSTFEQTEDRDKASAAAQAVYDAGYNEEVKKREEANKPKPPTSTPAEPETPPTLSPVEKAKKYGKGVAAAIMSARGGAGWGTGGTRQKRIEEKGMDYETVQKYISQIYHNSSSQNLKFAGVSSLDELEKLYNYKNFAFATGGYTGEWGNEGKLAILHEKELVLNKTDTSNLLAVVNALRNSDLVKQATSGMLDTSYTDSVLEELLSTINNTANHSTYDSIERGDNIVIENASVNMNVDSIASDYDARRAGSMAFDEMMKIARKTTNRSISRR